MCGRGPGRLPVAHLGDDVYGVDALEENISLGKELHQEIAEKLQVADLREPLTFETGFFDLVLEPVYDL